MKYNREAFEKFFAHYRRVTIREVESCRLKGDEGYWDEAHLNTRGISLAWHFWKLSIKHDTSTLSITNEKVQHLSLCFGLHPELVLRVYREIQWAVLNGNIQPSAEPNYVKQQSVILPPTKHFINGNIPAYTEREVLTILASHGVKVEDVHE